MPQSNNIHNFGKLDIPQTLSIVNISSATARLCQPNATPTLTTLVIDHHFTIQRLVFQIMFSKHQLSLSFVTTNLPTIHSGIDDEMVCAAPLALEFRGHVELLGNAFESTIDIANVCELRAR